MVTGGGGFLGKAIVKRLLKKNYNVTSFSRNFYPELDTIGVRQIQGDIAKKNIVLNAFKKIDAVFHVAAKAGMWGPFEEFFQANVIGTKNVISACLKNDIKQLIYTSSPSVVSDKKEKVNIDESAPYPKKYLTPYSETKAKAEQLVKQASDKNLKTIIIRPHLIWGPGDNHLVPRLIKRAKRLKRIGPEDCLMDTIYIENAADVHVLASEKLVKNHSLSGNTYFVSQDKPIAPWDMVDAVLDAAGLPPVKGHVSTRTAYMAGAVFEFIYKLFHCKTDPPITRFAAIELGASHWFNISKAKKDLGYYPKISTKEGLKILKLWFQKMEIKKDE
ncbi:MAG: NAD-dependent epimerase/dehydratase family protein [Desulfobacula sp.]|nr:NAD-dependent epimerase/dehydratase family protein [Desulfobacula sp.]